MDSSHCLLHPKSLFTELGQVQDKNVLQLAGINTESFSAHSTRSAGTSYAASKGVPISDILKS